MYANILCILDVLTDDQHAKLKALGTRVRFPADQTLFFEGQPSHSVLLIEDGNVKITKVAPDDTEMILAIRGAGELLGDEGVLMDEPRSATVTTITELSAIDVDAEELRRFVRDEDLWPTMYKAVVARGRQSDQRTLLGRLDVKYRLARWLLDIAAEVGEEGSDGWTIELTLSQQDMASRIGASRDAVAIELRRLRDKGLVSTGRRKIVLHDLTALNRIAAV
ncbi:Crp/Fnr family transcriptional regulator [Amycolatopsis sp. cg5]|uniref:Crp/Fnr family transcriptional regulator n=1 Tax=Amycolatopsis sp. cg5 TaxID=3238802 RepID=UPI003523A6C9